MHEITFTLSGSIVTGELIKKNHHTVWVKCPNSFTYGFGRIVKRHIKKHNVNFNI